MWRVDEAKRLVEIISPKILNFGYSTSIGEENYFESRTESVQLYLDMKPMGICHGDELRLWLTNLWGHYQNIGRSGARAQTRAAAPPQNPVTQPTNRVRATRDANGRVVFIPERVQRMVSWDSETTFGSTADLPRTETVEETEDLDEQGTPDREPEWWGDRPTSPPPNRLRTFAEIEQILSESSGTTTAQPQFEQEAGEYHTKIRFIRGDGEVIIVSIFD